MWRPVARPSLFLGCVVCLLSGTGCSLFRSDLADGFAPPSARHLPAIQTSADSAAPPADPLAVKPVQAIAASPLAESSPLAQAMTAETEEQTESSSAARDASCFVEIRALGEEPKRLRMSLEDATFVQSVLEKTGLVKEFRNMNIELSRKLEDGTRHKLNVRYDARKDRVVSAYDYALHPNDLLVIQEDSATSLDEMLKRLAGPLGR